MRAIAWPFGLSALAWTPLASAIALYGTGLWSRYTMPSKLWAWWTWLPYSSSNPVVHMWLYRSGAGSALVLAATSLFVALKASQAGGMGMPRPVKRGKSDNHGHAAWMSMSAARSFLPGPRGVVVGEAYHVDPAGKGEFDPANKSTWGRGGKAPLLIDPCYDGPTHSLIFAGTGGLKTTRAVTTLLYWDGPCVVLDPVGEIAPMLEDDFRARGKKVVVLSLRRPKDAERWGFNVLDWIDTKEPTAEADVFTVVSWIWSGDPTRASSQSAEFFESRGRELVACLLAHMLWDENGPRTLLDLREALVLPQDQMKALLGHVYQTSKSRLARQLAGTLVGAYVEEFSGVYSTAAKATHWLTTKAYASLVSGDAFRTSDLCRRDIAVFAQIPLSSGRTAPNLARTIIGSLLNALNRAEGKQRKRVLFLIDEAAQLGRMVELEVARDTMRKNGVTLQLLYQNTGQLVEQWGREGKEKWYSNVSWIAFSCVQDLTTAQELSAYFGDHAVMADSTAPGGKRAGKHEIRRRLLLPQEIMHETRADEIFVLMRGRKPLRCGAAVYFRRPELVSRVKTSAFVKQEIVNGS